MNKRNISLMQLLLFTGNTQSEYLSLLQEYTHSPKLKLTGSSQCRLDQTLSKYTASFKKSKSAKMLRIEVLFISQTLPYSFSACVRITPKIVTFVIGKMKLMSFSLFLDAPPTQNDIYICCKCLKRHVVVQRASWV